MHDDDLSKDLDVAGKAVGGLVKWFVGLWVAYVLGSIAAVVAVVYIALHFIIKFW